MDLQSAIRTIVEGHDLSFDAMQEVMTIIMSGDATPAQIAGFLIGLRMKGETIDEIAAAATVMRSFAAHVEVSSTPLIDTCGTGGDGIGTFNISTAAAFVTAAAGGRIAKHGNRAASSKSGSADVLEAAGVNLALGTEEVGHCIDSVGVGFMFAPAHHSAMKHVIAARREIGVRTVFNLLGPLTNPAGAPNQIMGVFDAQWIPTILETLKDLGSKHVLVVAADDSLDEISTSADTQVGELKEGELSYYQVSPEDFGIDRQADFTALQVGSAADSLELLKQALNYSHRAAGDIVALNAGAAIYAAQLTGSLVDGVEMAKSVLAGGEALAKLEALVAFTQSQGA